MQSVRIIGIDPGLNTTGYAVVDSFERKATLVEAGMIQPTKDAGSSEMSERLKSLYMSLMELLDQYSPSALSVEQLYAHYEHPRTAILMGHARGVIFLAGGMKDIRVHSYAATQIKKTVSGSGRASKEQIQMVMLREFGLKALPEPHDVADAMAIALCHHYSRTMPQNRETVSDGPKMIVRETRVKLPKFPETE
jgi:crossover junction endodeoxyribonuclease RuvC